MQNSQQKTPVTAQAKTDTMSTKQLYKLSAMLLLGFVILTSLAALINT